MSKLRIKDAQLLPNVDGAEKIPTGGRGDYAVSVDQIKDYIRGGLPQQIEDHINDTENPHQISKSQIGLGNVDNTSDVDKPISTATQEALDLKANQATTYTKIEVDGSLGLKADKTYVDSRDSLKADKTYVDVALSSLSTQASKFYPTLAQANADIANISVNQAVNVGEVDNGGLWYKATAGATTLTKSDYDPLTQAKSYTDQKTALKVEGAIGKNLFDKSKVTKGKGLGDTGTIINAATRSVSDFIPVLPNTAYSFTSIVKACFYDVSRNFVQLSAGALANVTTASNAVFMRLDVATALLDQAQAELGTVKTAYEPYTIFLNNNTVGESTIKNGAVSGDKLQVLSVEGKHFKNAVWLNNHNSLLLRKGISLNITNADGYTEIPNPAYDLTEFITVKPNTNYITSGTSRLFYYRKDGSFISAVAGASSFTTPAECYLVRCMLGASTSFRFQMNEGTTLPSSAPQPHKFYLPDFHITPQSKTELSATLGRKINFSDAWYAWRNNEKFPIAFLGDSTTNGNGTTGFAYRDAAASLGQDYIAPNSYTSVFQSLIREITGNTVMRAYNAGFSGRNAAYALANMDAIFSEAYSDVKMIGISMGINDRTASAALYARNFYRDIEGIIQWCLNKGIQPFLLTCQPVTIPGWVGEGTGADIQEVANEIKKNLADKYDLELVDVSKFGEQFMQYSTKPLLNNIMEAGSNVIHFGDGGHKFTAEFLFAHFCKRCIWTQDGEQLDYATQLMKSQIEHAQIKQINPFKQGFKVELNTTQATAENKLLQEFWVFNAGRKQLSLTAYYANAVTGQYVEVDGVQTTIASQDQALGSLDLGLHKIKAYSGATTQLDWLGFKLM